jgi:glutathione S-transferase
MAEYRLHCFAQSGNSYKPALLLTLAGADWEPAFVDFFNGGTRTPEYRATNVMGEAPVLEHGDLRLTQSGVILDYLAQRYRAFAPASEEERREVLRWTLWDNHKLTSYIATLRFLMNFVPEAKREPAVLAFLDARARAALRCSRRTSRRATGSPPTASPPPISPASAISTSRASSASTWPRSRTSTAGAGRSPPCPAGGIPTT